MSWVFWLDYVSTKDEPWLDQSLGYQKDMIIKRGHVAVAVYLELGM